MDDLWTPPWLLVDGRLIPPIAGGAPDEDDEEEKDREGEEESPPAGEESPTVADEAKEEEEEEKPVLSDEDIRAHLDRIFEEEPDRLRPHVEREISRRDEAVKAEREAEERARPLKEAITAARTSEDEDERNQALITLGKHTLAQITAAEARRPVEEELSKRFQTERLREIEEDFNTEIDRRGLREVGDTLTPEERGRFQMGNYRTATEWKWAVIDYLEAKAAETKPGSDRDKAERRAATAARAQQGARTPVLPGARGKQDKRGDRWAGKSARDVLFGDDEDDEE